MTKILTDPWAIDAPPFGPSDDDLFTGPTRPIHAASPLLGCTQHGRFWWQRGCTGCPDPMTYAHLYERLDEWCAAYRALDEARDQAHLDALQEGLL